MAQGGHAQRRVRGAREAVVGAVRHLALRARVLGALRAFFDARGFLEVDPPVRVAAPAPEPWIDAIPVASGGYLRTSPELHCKRLLAAGHERVYALGPCFRAGERTEKHREEFTMLEWYRAGQTYAALMDDLAALLPAVAKAAVGSAQLVYQGAAVDLARAERRTVREALATEAGLADADALDDDAWSVAIGTKVEPRLGRGHLTLLHDYPVTQAALARVRADDPRTAERVEAYVEGLELANGWTELTDPVEQRRRFEHDRARRAAMGKDPYPLDEAFLAALGRLGTCAGIALGVDRLVMLLADEKDIREVVAFPEG